MSTRARHIAALLDVHAEDLAFLWSQRRAALDSPEYSLREFAQLSERIEAHLQGLLIAPASLLIQRLQAVLAEGDRDDVFAAAFAALRCEDADADRQVMSTFARASGPVLLGLRDALGHVAPGRVTEELRRVLATAKPDVAAAAAVALANQRQLAPDAEGLARLLLEESALACAQGWAAAWRADCQSTSGPRPERPFREGLARPEADVRHEIWAATAWSGLVRAMEPLRQGAAGGDPVATHWLCVLGSPDDAKTLGTATMSLPDAGSRCGALARYGHPAALPTLIRWMEGADTAAAHAAGDAFSRITGCVIHGERRTLPVPDDADEFDRESAPLVWMPDAAKARRLLEDNGPRWNSGTRWCAGRRLDGKLTPGQLAELDLQARWDAAARAAMAGVPIAAPPPIG